MAHDYIINNKIQEKNTDKFFWGCFLLLLLLHSVVVLSIDYFPFADVPSHLAEGTIYRYYNNSSNRFEEFYTLQYFFYPNTFHLLFFSLPIFPDVETANKILHLLIVIGLPILILLILKEIGGSIWFSIISFILVYGYNLSYGFTGNAIANNVILLILLVWLKTINSNRNPFLQVLIISGLLVFVYFLHAMVSLYILLLVFSLIAYKYKNNLKGFVLHALCLLPLGLLILYWWFFIQNSTESSTDFGVKDISILAFLKDYYQSKFWITYPKRGMFLLVDNFQLFGGVIGYITGFLLAFIILIPILFLMFKNFYINEKLSALKAFLYKEDKFVYILIFFAVSAFCYFLLPT